MKHLTNIALFDGCSREYGGMEGLVRDYAQAGLDGIEVIMDHRPYTEELPPIGSAVGFHMVFWSFWVDFWNGNDQALLDEFDSWEVAHECYRGETRGDMIANFRNDLQHAIDLGSEYAVFHVSETSLRECYTYGYSHTDREVIDAAIEQINMILDGTEFTGAFLMENQWMSGLRFTDPALTRRLLDGVEYPNKGIMLDIGHLMSTNPKLRTQQEAARYVLQMYADHGDLGQYVRGLHLHKSLSGAYVEDWGYRIPHEFEELETYWEKYSEVYKHILQVDRHEPWDDPAVADVVRAIEPEWVNHELSAWPREPHLQALATQMDALARGGVR